MSSEPLTEQIPYKKTVWMYGFVKTTLSGALISTGVVLIFNGITDHPMFESWNEVAIIVGIVAILLAITIIFIIDHWKEYQKMQELKTIDQKFEDERKAIKAEREQMKLAFHEEAVEIAKEMVESELQKIKNDL